MCSCQDKKPQQAVLLAPPPQQQQGYSPSSNVGYTQGPRPEANQQFSAIDQINRTVPQYSAFMPTALQSVGIETLEQQLYRISKDGKQFRVIRITRL